MSSRAVVGHKLEVFVGNCVESREYRCVPENASGESKLASGLETVFNLSSDKIS